MVNQDDVLKAVRQRMDQYRQSVARITEVALSSADGHLLMHTKNAESDLESLCPLSGSLIGVAGAIRDIIQDRSLDDVIVRCDSRLVAVIRLEDESDLLLLLVVAERMVNLGLLLSAGQSCARDLVELVDGNII